MREKPFVRRLDMSKAGFWKDKAPLISRLDMELTERCNNDCIHCYINLPAHDAAAKKRELATAGVKKILAEAVSLGCLSVRFTGGEPLLREDFEELYVFARRSGLKVMIFTNATLITRRLAQLFCRIPPLEKIEVSLYGMTRRSYEAVSRIRGSFQAARQGIDRLLKHNIPFIVKNVLLPPNKNEIAKFESWAAAVPGMDSPPGYSMFFDLRARRDDEARNRMIRALRFSGDEGLAVLTRRKREYLKTMKEFCSKFMRPPGDELFSCGAGCGGCVDAYGNFQPCLMLRHPATVYDVKHGSLHDALTGFFPALRRMKAGNPDYLARCARCFLHGLCEQCPAKSWAEHGTLDTPVEYLCGVAHVQARYLGLIGRDETAWKVRNWRKRIAGLVNNGGKLDESKGKPDKSL